MTVCFEVTFMTVCFEVNRRTNLRFFLAFDFCRLGVIIRFYHPRHNAQWSLTSKDFYPRSYPLHSLSYFKLYLFYNETSYTTYINHAHWQRCLRSDGLLVGGNPPVWLGDHMTISHADAGYQTRVTAVRGECINTAPARQPQDFFESVELKFLIKMNIYL